MLIPRVIPVLLLTESGVVKTQRFLNPRYVGDPINALRVFNEKQVDEIILLDIEATAQGREPNFSRLGELASECFMPMGYGGGITTVAQAEKLFALGIEKVILNSAAVKRPALVREISQLSGAQSVAVCLDVKKAWLSRYRLHTHNGRVGTDWDPVEFARRMEQHGAGEIIIQSIERDGTLTGYDLPLVHQVAAAVSVPVVACGGASRPEDFCAAVREGASAAAAGSVFVFYGKHRAVLITYPTPQELAGIFSSLPPR
jgi:cyclase